MNLARVSLEIPFTIPDYREQLLKRARDDRVNREADRRKATAILSIQSLVRGFLVRRR